MNRFLANAAVSALLISSAVVSCWAQTYTITTVAGTGRNGASGADGLGDGGPALEAFFDQPQGLAVDSAGNLFIADSQENLVRKVSTNGYISVVAGNINSIRTNGGYYGDGGSAVGAGLSTPMGIAIDSAGDLYIADWNNNRVRKVSASGIITTVAGGGSIFTPGGTATQFFLNAPTAVVLDSQGNLLIGSNQSSGGVPTDSDKVFKVTQEGTITLFAGGNSALSFGNGNLGDNGPATSAAFSVGGLAIDASDNLYIADVINNRIRKVTQTGIITTVAGGNTSNYSGDGGPATAAGLNLPFGVAVDEAGSLYIADSRNYRIRKVTPDGTITTIAGTGAPGFSGDGGPAASAAIGTLRAVAVGNGGIYFTDRTIRVLTPASVAPSILSKGIVPIDSAATSIQPGEWVSIYGNNLASSSGTWAGDFPTSLDGTSVTINGIPAYLWYVSPTQINVQVPDDAVTGSVPVVVTTTAGGSFTSTVTLAPFAPSLLLLDSKHVTGIILRPNGSGAYSGGSYDIVGPTGASLGYRTVAAKAGDTVELFGVGFGPTNPVVPAGKLFSGSAPTTNTVKVFINNINVLPSFAGLSSAGLYQINLTLPAGLGTGDLLLVATVGGVQTQADVVISLQ